MRSQSQNSPADQSLQEFKPTESIVGYGEKMFRLLVDGVTEYAIYILDSKGRVATWNTGAERIKGYQSEEIIGQHFSVFYTTESVDRGWPQYELEVATREGRFEDEGWRVRKDGSTFWANVVITALQDATGMLLGFSKITRDLSDRKSAEEAILAENIELEQQVQLRIAELQKRNAELVRSNEELDDFAYIASHDLKEPLRGIHNYATFLIEDYGTKLDDEGLAKLETLKHLTRRMDTLLDSLLDSSRVGRVDFAIQETNLNDLLAEVLESLRIGLDERSIDVRIPKLLPTLRCDRVRIGEVLRNLITNAMKYNDKPQKWIEIGESSVPPSEVSKPDGQVTNAARPFIALYVRDNGIGIREKHFESIFRIFKRLHARDQFGGGTGAGLAIVKKIVERHGGHIWVESKYGEGTTFCFTLTDEETKI